MNKSSLLVGFALLATAPLAAQTAAPASAPASAPSVTAGATVSDASGGAVGTVTQVANGNATIDTGTVKAAVPVTSFAQGTSGLVLGMTKAQLEAAVAGAKPAEIAVGTKVVGPNGNPVGTVAAVAGDLVTIQMPSAKVQVPKSAFAQNASGTLAIGMTQDQLEAAAKSAGGKPG